MRTKGFVRVQKVSEITHRRNTIFTSSNERSISTDVRDALHRKAVHPLFFLSDRGTTLQYKTGTWVIISWYYMGVSTGGPV